MIITAVEFSMKVRLVHFGEYDPFEKFVPEPNKLVFDKIISVALSPTSDNPRWIDGYNRHKLHGELDRLIDNFNKTGVENVT